MVAYTPDQNAARHGQPVSDDGLPASAQLPALYQAIMQSLRNCACPAWLVRLGGLMRQIERGTISPMQIEATLGAEAASIATALAEIAALETRPAAQSKERSWRLFLLLHRNPSAGLLKIVELSEILHLAVPSDLRSNPAMITDAAFAAGRLGLWNIRCDLLTAAATLADPHLVAQAKKLQEQTSAQRNALFEELKQTIERLLEPLAIRPRIERLDRPVYKLVDELPEGMPEAAPWADMLQIMVDNEQDCYLALSAIHRSFPVVSPQLRDYIGYPKPNGYREIRTIIEYVVSEKRSYQVDIHIATETMARFNREGFLAFLAGFEPSSQRIWWLDTRRWDDAYQQRSQEIFVFTPHCEPIYLPASATVLDFAMRVHRRLGVYCHAALINGTPATLGDELQCGDICEVLLSEQNAVLNGRLLDLVKTRSAKVLIRQVLRRGDNGAAMGRIRFEQRLEQLLRDRKLHADTGWIKQLVIKACAARGYHTPDAFYRAVGRSEIATDQVAALIIDELLVPRLDLQAIPEEIRVRAAHRRIAQCCKPCYGDELVASIVHAGHQIKIHRAGCHNAHDAYPVGWKPDSPQVYTAEVLYEGWDKPGLLREITTLLDQQGPVNIRALEASVPEPSLARIHFSFESVDPKAINAIRSMLEAIPEQRRVEIHSAALIDGTIRISQPLENHYGPQPVGRWPFFVGRAQEVRRILTHLECGGAGHILICGPKRIGKSSLLDHLGRHHLGGFQVPEILNLQALPSSELAIERMSLRLARMAQQITRDRRTLIDAHDFADDPISALASTLETLRASGRSERFIVRIDELGVLAERFGQTSAAGQVYDQWRALFNDTRISQHLAFIFVMPDAALQHSSSVAPELRIGELGTIIRLPVLAPDDVRNLMTLPIRMHFEYDAADLAHLIEQTGCHPYYTHLVCGQIVLHMQTRHATASHRPGSRELIPSTLVAEALEAVRTHEDAFFHILKDSSPTTCMVLQNLARRAGQEWLACEQLYTALDPHNDARASAILEHAIYERPDLLEVLNGTIRVRAGLVVDWLKRQ